MVTIGSVAISHPELFAGWLDRYGADRIILGADVRNGKISINGWKEDSTQDLLPFLAYYIEKGVKNVLCTEISKDGMLSILCLRGCTCLKCTNKARSNRISYVHTVYRRAI